MVALAAAYRSAVRVTLVLQVFAALLLVSLLDGGTLARAGGCAVAGFWVGVAIVMIRRPRTPSELDLLYVRWGFLALLVVACCGSPWMGVLRR